MAFRQRMTFQRNTYVVHLDVSHDANGEQLPNGFVRLEINDSRGCVAQITDDSIQLKRILRTIIAAMETD